LHTNKIIDDKTFLINNKKVIPLNIFGDHNMQNISGAIKVLNKLAIQKNIFYKAIQSYNAPKIRLEIIKKFNNNYVFRDFAHSPSKVISTVKAVKKQFKNKLYSILELHTLSCLNENFLYNYKNTLNHSEESLLYYSKKEIIKKFTEKKFQKIFNNNKLLCCNNLNKLKELLKKVDLKQYNILLMSSGNFDGLKINKIF